MQRHGLARAAMWSAALMAITGTFSGCHQKTHAVTAADVAARQAEAQKELSEARLEAKKDVRNAAKLAGADSKNVMVARATGSFDVAMANADGAHKVAIEQCLTLPKDAQQPCKDRADADYQAAVADAKALRVAQLQKAP
jgi:hypothetical protein